jgi:hypothetical protein
MSSSSSTYVLAPQLELNLPIPPPSPSFSPFPAASQVQPTRVQPSTTLSINGSQVTLPLRTNKVPTPPPKTMTTGNHQQQLFKQKKQYHLHQAPTLTGSESNPSMMIIGVKIKDPIIKYPTNSLVFH